MRYSITSNLRIYQRIGKTCFSVGKIEFWTHWELCAYHKIFCIRQERLWIFISTIWSFTRVDNMWNQSTLSIQVYIQQWFHDEQEAKF